MTDRLREAAQAALDDLEARCGTNAPERGPDGSITKLRAALAEQTVKESLTTQPSIIDSIADNLVGDHIALMNENRMLRAALAEPEVKQEPVAWQYVWEPGMYYTTDSRATMDRYVQGAEDRLPPEKRGHVRPLYAAPQRREWVGLTDDEIAKAIRPLCQNTTTLGQLLSFSMPEYRAIEAALKERNG